MLSGLFYDAWRVLRAPGRRRAFEVSAGEARAKSLESELDAQQHEAAALRSELAEARLETRREERRAQKSERGPCRAGARRASGVVKASW